MSASTIATTSEWFETRAHLEPEQWDAHWRNYHRMKHMERRLVALGRTDIVEEADEYADERMRG